MDGASVLLVVAVLGVSFGWQPDADDPTAYEVTAQIEPELLDVLKSGADVPIETHVPAEVAPIRKVRIVVGNSTLPRQAINDAARSGERIVRGQSPDAQSHTARYENDPWVGDRYSAGNAPSADSRLYDQRGATIGADTVRTAQAPSPWARAETAATETGNMLRDGVEAGIQQANQQWQNLTGSATGPSQPSTWPAPPPSFATSPATAASASSPPSVGPPPSLGAAPPVTPVTQGATATPWTSIRPEVAPPRLMNPPLAPMNTATTAPRVASNPASSGPSIPSLETRSPLHSVLVDPTATSAPTATSTPSSALPPPPTGASQPNWASGWGTAGTSTAAASQAQLPAPPVARDPAEEIRWEWPTPVAAAGQSTASDAWAGFPPQQNASSTIAQAGQNAATSPPSQPAIDTASTAASKSAPTPGEPLPWMPLLVVSVSLAGSLGANLFLGWSYADARQRYRSLVRKTTNSFHRATGAAA